MFIFIYILQENINDFLEEKNIIGIKFTYTHVYLAIVKQVLLDNDTHRKKYKKTFQKFTSPRFA